MYQTPCYYYPRPDFTDEKQGDSEHCSDTFVLMTYVAVGPDPRRPFRDNHLALSLAVEVYLLGLICLSPPHPHPPQGNKRKMNGSLSAENRGSAGPDTLG